MPDDAVAVAVAKAVVAQLAAATLSQEIAPERSYADWELALEDECLHVDVALVTTKMAAELSNRTRIKYTVPVDIAVRRRFGSDKQDDDTGRIVLSEVDALMLLVQEIHELFTPQRLTAFEAGVWQETQILAAPVRKLLHELRQFVGIVRVTFRVDQVFQS